MSHEVFLVDEVLLVIFQVLHSSRRHDAYLVLLELLVRDVRLLLDPLLHLRKGFLLLQRSA